MNRGTLRKDFIQAYTQSALCSWRNACVAALLTSTFLLIGISATCQKPFILLKKCLTPS